MNRQEEYHCCDLRYRLGDEPSLQDDALIAGEENLSGQTGRISLHSKQAARSNQDLMTFREGTFMKMFHSTLVYSINLGFFDQKDWCGQEVVEEGEARESASRSEPGKNPALKVKFHSDRHHLDHPQKYPSLPLLPPTTSIQYSNSACFLR